MSLSRRQLLRASAGSLLAAGTWPGSLAVAEAPPATETFSFVVLNDLHYLDDQCGPWQEAVVRRIKAHDPKPRFCLIVGDLTEDATPEQFDAVRTIYGALGVPVHYVPGNHDWDKELARNIYDQFYVGATNYHFEAGGWLFVALDSTDGRGTRVSVREESLKWLDATLPTLDRKKPLVLFTHYPLGPWVFARANNAEQVLERFKGHNLQAVYNGHFHSRTERRLGGTVLTTNQCCSFSHKNHDLTKEKGYFLCQARDGTVARAFVEHRLDTMPPMPK